MVSIAPPPAGLPPPGLPLRCPCYCQGCPRHAPPGSPPARVAPRRPLRDPGRWGGRAQDARPQHRRSGQQRPSWAREALAPAGGPAFRAWPSPFCHMNELGSGIGLEGVLNTVWVKQIVPLPVDPGKCIGSSNSSSQHVPPRPAGRLEV